MVRRDTLWKALIEELVEDFLYFFFPTYMDQIDLRRGVVFLDKDLERIMPEADTRRRHADKLFKVWLNDGEEHWFLAHVEVQGYPDADFAFRMFQYYYRILDRYNKPVTAIALYTDTNRAYHATAYRTSFMGTELIYRFQSFILADKTPEDLRASGNPFGLALETAYRALDPRLKEDNQLMISKLELMRHLLSRGLDKAKIRQLYNFINMYVSFQNSENKLKFENEVRKITKSREPMGLEEAILKEVLEQGIEQGVERKAHTVVIRAHEKGLSMVDIAEIAGLTVEEVASIIADYEADKGTSA